MPATVKEIARRSGVSPATVSRILNGSGGVSEEKRLRVLQALEGEAPPDRTRRVRTGRNIGLLLLPGSEQDAKSVIAKLDAIVRKLPAKWNLILLPPDISPFLLESRCLRGELAGLLIAGHGDCAEELMRILPEVPHVWLNSRRERGKADTVLMGNEFAGRIAGRYLIDSGCLRPAVLSLPSRNPGFRSRIDGFCYEFFSQGRSFETLAETAGACFENLPNPELEKLLDRLAGTGDYDGLFVPEERLTALLHRALQKRGRAPWPRLVSCNYTPEYLAGLWPRPASVALGSRMVAELGFEELLRRISGEGKRPDNVAIIVTPELIPGDLL